MRFVLGLEVYSSQEIILRTNLIQRVPFSGVFFPFLISRLGTPFRDSPLKCTTDWGMPPRAAINYPLITQQLSLRWCDVSRRLFIACSPHDEHTRLTVRKLTMGAAAAAGCRRENRQKPKRKISRILFGIKNKSWTHSFSELVGRWNSKNKKRN